MRLPSSLLAKLTLTGLAFGAACEAAHEPEHCKSEPTVANDDVPLDEVVRMTNERPAFAPKVTPEDKPVPQPVKQPTVQTKPKPRKVFASVCGHTQLVDENATTVKCGRG
jgi:hypothetical protein